MSHTPGPWEWWTSNSWRRLRRSERGVSTNVLYPCVHEDGQPDVDVSQADMLLIAAAPDLLAALMRIERESVDDVSRADARAAIAKAEGKA